MIMRSLFLLSHNMFSVILGVLGLTFLIAIHEFGHFLFCKVFNIKTPTFSIGFGPQLFSKKIGDTNFAFSAIPFGGYVEIAGLAEVGQGEQKEAHHTDSRSFSAKPYWQKLLVMVGGIGVNLLFAYFALILLFWVGFPKTQIIYPLNANTTIKAISEDSPAAHAGLEVGDRIVAVNSTELNNSAMSFREHAATLADQDVRLTIERDGVEREVPAKLGGTEVASGKRVGMLGVEFELIHLRADSLPDAFIKGIKLTNRMMSGIAHAFLYMFKTRDISGIGGPVQIISATVKGAGESLWVFLLILAMISVNLAVLNVLPLPILDGGQILYFTIEAIVRRPLPVRVREYIHIISWLLVLALIIYLSGQDLYRLIKPWFIKA
jgi:regulator of sigma E protease